MTPEIALARRAVAAGMHDPDVEPTRIIARRYPDGETHCTYRDPDGVLWVDVSSREAEECDWLPDLTDPATLGCLLALVREAWGDPEAYVSSPIWSGEWAPWRVHPGRKGGRFPVDGHTTEAAALVAALEAAPGRST